MTSKDLQLENQAHLSYLNREINEYELADLLGLQYDEIGVYIMCNGLHLPQQTMENNE